MQKRFKKWMAVAALAWTSVGMSGLAQARDVVWSVGVHNPGVSVSVGSGYPVVVPAPVYVSPRVVYAPPPPVYYAPPPPRGYYYGPPPRRIKHGHHGRPMRHSPPGHHRHHRH